MIYYYDFSFRTFHRIIKICVKFQLVCIWGFFLQRQQFRRWQRILLRILVVFQRFAYLSSNKRTDINDFFQNDDKKNFNPRLIIFLTIDLFFIVFFILQILFFNFATNFFIAGPGSGLKKSSQKKCVTHFRI